MKLYGAFLLGAALAAASFFLRLPYALWTALTGLSTTVPPGAPLAMLAMALAVWGVGLTSTAPTRSTAPILFIAAATRACRQRHGRGPAGPCAGGAGRRRPAHTGGLLARGLSGLLLYGFPIPAQSPDPGFFARF